MTVGNYTEIVHLIPYHPILNVLHNMLRLLYQQNYFVLYIIFVDVACRTPVHAFRHRHLKLGSSLLLTFHFFPLTCTCNDEAVLGYLIITTNLGIPSPYKSSSWQQTVTKQWFIILSFFCLALICSPSPDCLSILGSMCTFVSMHAPIFWFNNNSLIVHNSFLILINSSCLLHHSSHLLLKELQNIKWTDIDLFGLITFLRQLEVIQFSPAVLHIHLSIYFEYVGSILMAFWWHFVKKLLLLQEYNYDAINKLAFFYYKLVASSDFLDGKKKKSFFCYKKLQSLYLTP